MPMNSMKSWLEENVCICLVYFIKCIIRYLNRKKKKTKQKRNEDEKDGEKNAGTHAHTQTNVHIDHAYISRNIQLTLKWN